MNETFARRMFGESPALGRQFALADKSVYSVSGIVENGKYDSLTEALSAALFFPLAQSPSSDTVLVVRSQRPSSEIAAELSRLFPKIDPALPVTIHTWQDALALVLFPARAATISLGVMGALAAMLAVTGVFGMAAYSVSKRRRELGIRIALGAQASQLMRAALGRPLSLLIGGSAAGFCLGVFASRLLAQIVYGASPRDPLVLAGVLCAMSLLGAVATWIPARRALAISPAALLKEE